MAAVPVKLFKAAATIVEVGGTAVDAIYGPVLGGMITNPARPEDQGIQVVEPLFINMVTAAPLIDNSTTFVIQPGESYFLPANVAAKFSVNAPTSGHRFSAFVVQPVPLPPTPPSRFPPSSTTSLTEVIPSYLYQQYADDEDLQGFVDAYNQAAQQYVDWFGKVPLPVYTDPAIAGALLDWIARGLYGVSRPALSSGRNRNLGPLNTYAFNTLPLNTLRRIGSQNVVTTSDDIFKRIITWHFFKGDGKVFNIRWLKRRIMRFLNGTNGVNYNVDQTYQISVGLGAGNIVSITLLNGVRTVIGGAFYNGFRLNQRRPLNSISTRHTEYAQLQNAQILKEAIESGALELPFQFTYSVVIR